MSATVFDDLGFDIELKRAFHGEETRRKPNRHAEPREPIKVYRGSRHREAPTREMVIKNLMGSGELTFTHGAPKSGKSFLKLDCALAVAAGDEHWFGHRIKRSGQVVYLVQEGAGGFPLRLEAWSRFHGRPVPENFLWTPTRLRFVEDGTAGAAVEDVQRVAQLVAELERETGEPVVLIVIDTAARVRAGADENSAKDMGMFLEACAVLQDLSNRPHINVIAHDNTNGTMRGSTAQHAGGDGFLHVERHGDTRTWCLEMAKDDPETPKRAFKLETVELGTDEDGDPVRSCVVVEDDSEVSAELKTQVKLGDREHATLTCLSTALADYGREPPPSHDIPHGVQCVRYEDWQQITLRYVPPGPDFRRREAFKRSFESLRRKGLIRHADGWCWLPKGGGNHRTSSCDGRPGQPTQKKASPVGIA